MKTTIICKNCDDAFEIKYSPYSSKKTFICPTCGTPTKLLKEKSKETTINKNVQNSIEKKIEKLALPPCVIERRYIVSGLICFVMGILSAMFSVETFTIYIPFLTLALVFGVLSIVNKRIVYGMSLIVVTIVFGTLICNYALNRDLEKAIQKVEPLRKEMEESLNAIEQDFLQIFK